MGIYLYQTICNVIKVGLSPSKIFCFIWFNESPLKVTQNAFYFIWKSLFILKILEFFSSRLGHVEKMAWLWRSNLFNKQWQYTYCPIFNKEKATRQWNLVNYQNITESFHVENEAGRLVPDLFLFFRKALYQAKASGQ